MFSVSDKDTKTGFEAFENPKQPQEAAPSVPPEEKSETKPKDDFLPPDDFGVEVETSNPFEDITSKQEDGPEPKKEKPEEDSVSAYEAMAQDPNWNPFPTGLDEEDEKGQALPDASFDPEVDVPESQPHMKDAEEKFEALEVPDDFEDEEIPEIKDDADEAPDVWEFEELSVDELESLAPVDFEDDDLPTLTVSGFGSMFSDSGEEYETDAEMDEAFEGGETLVKDPTDMYGRVLLTLFESEDLGIDATAKARIGEAMKEDKLPQIIARDLVNQRVVNSVQLARSVARSLKRKEITTFLNVPAEASDLRSHLDTRAVATLRESRVIPLWYRELGSGKGELHLAHETAMRDLVLESSLREIMPNTNFVWHFAQRDVCGAFWLAGENEDVDSSMEAEALLDRIVGNAIDARSSDIHIDPSIKGEAKAIVKYRVDGFVQSKEVITLDQLDRLRVRIENVSRMPKVDLHHPNKGAFTRNGFDWRVQVQPHAGRQGPLPRIVIRRLQPDVLPMETLGYPQYFIDQIKSAASAPNGVIFWTGPTGSGKTESIHSAVVSSNPMGRGLSVHTIEDPPEKRVPGYAVQMEVSDADPARSGLELLKSSLRADPDVVIFGEVRDTQMAGLVFEAANTGHLVFTTLHTNTSLDAIVRLDEMGIYGFHISYVRGIAAQRLVRRLCTHCRIPEEEPDEYTKYVFQKYGVELEGAKLFRHNPEGCASCQHRGYYGRIAIAEWLQPNKELVEASGKRNYDELEEIARRAGWKPMGYMGVLHVKDGITDCAELSAKVLELSGEIL